MTNSLPSQTWQMLEQNVSGRPLPQGLDAAWDAALAFANRFVPRLKKYMARVDNVFSLEKYFSQMTDAKLRDTASDLHARFRCSRHTPQDVEYAFALIREVASRQIGECPYPVQVAGAFAIADGCIAEMATGEGKTLTCTMPAVIAGWHGKGCHVITVNDYLAKRDATWMNKIYSFCGLNAAYIEQETPAPERRKAYLADLTYCTNKEVAADFLRDRLILSKIKGLTSALLTGIISSGSHLTDRLVQRGLNHAIIDEADSVLVDEAVTPLIISGQAPNPEQIQAFSLASQVADQLAEPQDYFVDYRFRDIELTPAGRTHVAQLTENFGPIWHGARRREELVVQALTAKIFYLLGKHYIIDDGKVVIVDEFTGRLMPDRTWRDGLHQAVEAKEKLTVNPPKDTYARISFQRFFRIYRKLAGMTGTAQEAANEFWQIYHLPVVVIPTNRPCIRKNLPDIVLPTEEKKWHAIVHEIKHVHQTRRPILVGTRSVRASEYLSSLLTAENLDHQVLNAVFHQQEAQIVAGAGKFDKITVATNMAGRGTDIKLEKGVSELGGLYVIATERHESARIDRQLFGRCARQGDPGSVRAIVSLEDELIIRHASKITSALKSRILGNNGDISSSFVPRLFKYAQYRAEKFALRQRKAVLRTDNWLDEQLGFAGTE